MSPLLEKGDSLEQSGHILERHNQERAASGIQRLVDFARPQMVIALHVEDHGLDARRQPVPAKSEVECFPCFLLPLQGHVGKPQVIPGMTVAVVFGEFFFEQIKIAFVFSFYDIGFEPIPEMLDFKLRVDHFYAGFDQKSVHGLVHAARKPNTRQISKKTHGAPDC